jgi:hypothetical protein
MNDRLSFSIFTIELDGKPTLAFDAKRYSEAEAICGDEGLRAKLSLLKSGDVPLCGDNAILDVRLAHPDEAALYRQAAGASQSTDDLMLVYRRPEVSRLTRNHGRNAGAPDDEYKRLPNRGRAGIAEFGGSDQALIRRQSRCKRKANAGFQPLPHAWLVGQASAFRQGQTLSLDGERRAAKRPGRQREMERLSGFFDEL